MKKAAPGQNMRVIPDVIVALRNDLKITTYGGAKLAPFPAKVILKARDKLRIVRGKDIKIAKPFNYFFSLCTDIAKELKVTPNWNRSLEICEYYGIIDKPRVTTDDEFLLDTPSIARQLVNADEKRSQQSYAGSGRKRGPTFDGQTYTKYGIQYSRPVEYQEQEQESYMERAHWTQERKDKEKRDFIESVTQGACNMKGIEFLHQSGLITKEELAEIKAAQDLSSTDLSTTDLSSTDPQPAQFTILREEEPETLMVVDLPGHRPIETLRITWPIYIPPGCIHPPGP